MNSLGSLQLASKRGLCYQKKICLHSEINVYCVDVMVLSGLLKSLVITSDHSVDECVSLKPFLLVSVSLFFASGSTRNDQFLQDSSRN